MAARVQRLLEVDADVAFREFCDLESIPKWVEPVARVEVLQRRPDGRAAEVEFEAQDGDGGSMRYSLRYAYDVPGRRIMWRPGQNPEAGIRGVAVFEPDAQGCRMVYTIQIGPTWADDYAKARALATAVVDAFADWIDARREA